MRPDKVKTRGACVAIFLLFTAFASGCVDNAGSIKEQAKAACVQACENAVSSGVDISAGPCLSESVVPGWVCDVAHNPRQPIDDLRENQCQSYPQAAQHFVEVDPACSVIRVV